MKTAALRRAATILAVKGGTPARDHRRGLPGAVAGHRRPVAAHEQRQWAFYQLLHEMGVFAPDAPSTIRVFGTTGQLSPAQLIDRYGITCRPVRDVLVAYLQERQPMLDHTTLTRPGVQPGWAVLAGPGTPPPRHRFAAPRPGGRRGLETARPDQDPAGRRARRADQRGPGTARRWPAQPGRRPRVLPRHRPVGDGGPGPVGDRGRRRARSAPRTWPDRRRSAPASRGWISAPGNGSRSCRCSCPGCNDARTTTAASLAAAQATTPGGTFTGRRRHCAAPHLQRRHRPDLGRGPRHRQAPRPVRRGGPGVLDLGRSGDVAPHRDPHRGAHRAVPPQPDPVHAARHRGARPAAADRTVEDRHRTAAGHQPRTRRRPRRGHHPDPRPGTARWAASPPTTPTNGSGTRRCRCCSSAGSAIEHRAIPAATIREWINGALDGADITDAAGQPLRFTPHDFRRLFITDAVLHGMPPHIAQLVAGHRDINTTMGYKAVYPDEVINGHRAFIARRRALRPSAEYRVPTEQEWEEFLGHFERRKLSLGTCGRSYATPCIHEHACLRCPLLRPDPAQRPGWSRSATTSTPASPKPAAKAGSARSTGCRSASTAPARNSPNSTRSRPRPTEHPTRDAHLHPDRRTLCPASRRPA